MRKEQQSHNQNREIQEYVGELGKCQIPKLL
jgi:hypothetical protein